MIDVQAIRRYCSICSAVFRSEIARCPRDGGRIEERNDNPVLNLVLGDRYRIVEVIGVGGMGEVYRVQHTNIDKPFAAKIMLGEMAANKQMVSRFHREAKALSRLSHPNIVSVTDFGQSESGLLYLITEFIDGKLLSDELIENGALQPRRAVWLVRQIALALLHAHKRGLVHRDLKASNIMLTVGDDETESVKVLDFGIAIMVDGAPTASTDLTTQGMVMGTPTHMSPEQARGEKLDGRSDLYTLGIMFHQMLTGTPPFTGDSAIDILSQHLKTPPPRIERPDVGTELGDVILKLLAKNRDDRYADARELIEALDRLPEEHLSNPAIRVLQSVLPARGAGLDSMSLLAASHLAGLDTPPRVDPLKAVSLPIEENVLIGLQEKSRRTTRLQLVMTLLGVAIALALLLVFVRSGPETAASASASRHTNAPTPERQPEDTGAQPASDPAVPGDKKLPEESADIIGAPVLPAKLPPEAPSVAQPQKKPEKKVDKKPEKKVDKKPDKKPEKKALSKQLDRVGKTLDKLPTSIQVDDLRSRYFELGMEVAALSDEPAARRAFAKKVRALRSAIRKRKAAK